MIALIDYDAGNTCSVMNALNRLNVNFRLTSDSREISQADKVIFPGVGHAGSAMAALKNKGLVETIINLKQPVLGICVGMQLLCAHSEEGDTTCLGILPLTVTKMIASQALKVPHMGWNQIQFKKAQNPLLNDINNGEHFYFVHSYYVPSSAADVAITNYGGDFAAMVHKDNFYGIQFHAEKSGRAGEQMIKNFIEKA
jgi:glutamine amidotransferase